MPSFVLDASVTLPWCFVDEATPWTDSLLFRLRTGTQASTPAHWPLEVVNALLIATRRGRILAQKAERFLRDLERLPVHVEGPSGPSKWQQILMLATVYRLTAYDAAYLELAQRTGLPLATLDEELRKAARVTGVALVPEL